MAYTLTDLANIKEAIATGALKVKFGSGPDSREIEYRSLTDMLAVQRLIEGELFPASQPIRTSYIAHSRD